jgi:hypothetical protein
MGERPPLQRRLQPGELILAQPGPGGRSLRPRSHLARGPPGPVLAVRRHPGNPQLLGDLSVAPPLVGRRHSKARFTEWDARQQAELDRQRAERDAPVHNSDRGERPAQR